MKVSLYKMFHCMECFIVWKVLLYGKFYCMESFIVWKVLLYGKCYCMESVIVWKVLLFWKCLYFKSSSTLKVSLFWKFLYFKSFTTHGKTLLPVDRPEELPLAAPDVRPDVEDPDGRRAGKAVGQQGRRVAAPPLLGGHPQQEAGVVHQQHGGKLQRRVAAGFCTCITGRFPNTFAI